jgi:hypothetical protein
MYNAGGGGETFIQLITKYSDRFKKMDDTVTYSPTNRTMLKYPRLWEVLSTLRSPQCNLDTLAQKVIESCESQKYDVAAEIAAAESFLNDSKPPLIKMHVSFNEYFNGKTYLLVPDAEKWSRYSGNLSAIKMYAAPIDEAHLDSTFANISINATDTQKRQLAATRKYIDDNEVRNVTLAQIEATIFDDTPMSCAEAFGMSAIAIIKQHSYDKFETPYKEFVASIPQSAKDNFTIIPYSKIFEKGYLENLFGITSPDFNLMIRDWHSTNVDLMNAHGFTYE